MFNRHAEFTVFTILIRIQIDLEIHFFFLHLFEATRWLEAGNRLKFGHTINIYYCCTHYF